MTVNGNVRRIERRAFAVAMAAALAVAGCGSSTVHSASNAAATIPRSTADAPPVASELGAAEHPTVGQFPEARGRTLQQLTELGRFGAQLGAATGTFTPGARRFAFGVNASSGAFIYAPTAVYIATSANSPAQGPFLAPADPMSVASQFRSAENRGPGGIRAIYWTDVPLPHAGTYAVLSLTRTPGGLIASPGEIAVAPSSPVPQVGQRPPAIMTDTLATVHGDVALLTTRTPPEQMHAVSFKDELGRRPIALLFSTPALCTSKICGPVTDILVSLQHEYAGRITFIHQEVFADNDPAKGLRSQMQAFHLQTEPWLFTVNSHGIIAARLEGAFGVNEARGALEAALS
ncbi:MAG: hypothetical protein ACLP50_00205 [Solirubrobacteraceae bacterium]